MKPFIGQKKYTRDVLKMKNGTNDNKGCSGIKELYTVVLLLLDKLN
jgi:hypothetical protein